MHMAWVRLVCGRIKSDFRYSTRLVYNTYPWPDDPSEKQLAAVEAAAQVLLDEREKYLKKGETLANLYDPIAMPPALARAHAALDRAVDRCYRREPFTSDGQQRRILVRPLRKAHFSPVGRGVEKTAALGRIIHVAFVTRRVSEVGTAGSPRLRFGFRSRTLHRASRHRELFGLGMCNWSCKAKIRRETRWEREYACRLLDARRNAGSRRDGDFGHDDVEEIGEFAGTGGLLQLAEGLALDLPDALARDREDLARPPRACRRSRPRVRSAGG